MDVVRIVLDELDLVARLLGKVYDYVSLDDLKEIGFEAAVDVINGYRRDSGDLRAYARTRLRGAILDHFRTEARRRRLLLEGYEAPSSFDGGLSSEDVVVARELVERLEGVEREVVLRRFWGDEDLDDIASSKGRNKSWSTRIMQRAIERMAA